MFPWRPGGYVVFFDLIWRTALFYVLILVVLRLLGKREVDQLAPIDLIVMIMIAELAVIPIEDNKMPIWAGIIPIAVLGILEVGLALACLWSGRFRGSIPLDACGGAWIASRKFKRHSSVSVVR